MPSSLVRGLAVLVTLAVAAYVAALGYLYAVQRTYVFRPGGELAAPAALGLSGVRVEKARARDGTELTEWRATAAPGAPTVLYFHGNAGNLSDRADRFRQILASGFGLVAVSYRGFPGNGGSPSQAAIFSDALESFDRLARDTPEIIAYGESLGTGVAAYVAANRPARALVLEAPYTAALDIARAIYPWAPVSLLMRDPFTTRDIIGRVTAPVLIVHGTADPVIPVAHGRRLYEMANEPKQLAIIEGGAHSDLWGRGLWPIVLEFLQANHIGAPAAPITPSSTAVPKPS